MKTIADYILLMLLLCVSVAVPAAYGKPAATAEILPNLELPIPENDAYREYLGLTGKSGKNFTLTDIKADILLIELFSMYCPYCQDAAPAVNELYEKTEEISKRGPRVKIIGLGASNTQFEVEYFRDTYNISFPLFPDRDRAMYHALSGAGTPTFVGCRLTGGGKPTIVFRHSGDFNSADLFLKKLIDKSGL